MKLHQVILAIVLAGSAAGQENSTIDPPFTPETLLRKIALRDKGDLTTNQLVVLVKSQGVSFKWNYDTWSKLQRQYKSKQLDEINEVFTLVGLSTTDTDSTPPNRLAEQATTPRPAPTLATITTNTLTVIGNATVTVSGAGTNAVALTGDTTNGFSVPANGASTLTFSGTADKTNVLTAPANATVAVTSDNANVMTMRGDSSKIVVLAGEGKKRITVASNESFGPPTVNTPLFLLGGAKFQNSYVVSVDKTSNVGTLTNSGNTTVSFFGIAWADRYALVGADKGQDPQTNFFGFWKVMPDFEAQVGFVFGNNSPSDSDSTSYSASTLAGGGDFYASVGVGLPFFRHETDSLRHQITLELNGSVSSDKQFEQLHDTALFGLGYQLGYRTPDLYKKSDLCGFLSFRIGAGLVDVPEIIDTTASAQYVNVSGGLPQFVHKWCPAGSVTLAHPVTDGVYLFIAANFFSLGHSYSTAGPDQWNVTVGASMTADTIKKRLGGMLGLQ